MLTMDFLSL